MTLLKQVSCSSAADDNLSDAENNDDIQTDGCTRSLTAFSLEKEILGLTLYDLEASKTAESCESGIASCNEVSSTPSGQTTIVERLQPTQSEKLPEGDLQVLAHISEQLSNKSNDKGTRWDTVAMGKLEQKEGLKLKKPRQVNNKRSPVRWDEMTESFPDEDGDTLLHLAVIQAVTHLAEVVRLLGLQEQVNWRNRLYQTPLHLAVITGNTRALPPLLCLQASLSAQDCRGNTPLHAACQRNDIQALQVLVDCDNTAIDDDADREILESEEKKARRKVAKQWRKREVAAALSTRNYDGFTCLHIAVLHCRDDIVAVLLRQGADVNAMDGKSGRTSLHFAVDCREPSSEVLAVLLTHPDLRINAANFAQQTALQLARGRHHLDIVERLHSHGAVWSDSIPGYYSSDNFSEEDMEEEHLEPYNDFCIAGELLVVARHR